LASDLFEEALYRANRRQVPHLTPALDPIRYGPIGWVRVVQGVPLQ
jgi:hypothetical protein